METFSGLWLCPTVASAAVYLTMVGGFLQGMRRHRRVKHQFIFASGGRVPRVSILKPLAGTDDELAENLASFARLSYPDYEILLGVTSSDDPAYAVAVTFARRFPEANARVLITRPNDAPNPKVAQLLTLQRAAGGEILVVSDSNVRVGPSYLAHLVSELCAPGVALVTSVIAGTGERSMGAALENLQLGALVAPGVVAMYNLMSKTISVGKSMAMWADRLASVGGFARVGHLLGEDHMLGRAFEEAGMLTRISLEPVHNRNIGCSVSRTLERHTRWAKLRRSITPATFTLEPLLSPVLVATSCCLLSPSRLTCAAALLAACLQTAGAFATTRALRGHAFGWYLAPLEILRCYLMLCCWLRACVSTRVSWRGHEMILGVDSAILPNLALAPSAQCLQSGGNAIP